MIAYWQVGHELQHNHPQSPNYVMTSATMTFTPHEDGVLAGAPPVTVDAVISSDGWTATWTIPPEAVYYKSQGLMHIEQVSGEWPDETFGGHPEGYIGRDDGQRGVTFTWSGGGIWDSVAHGLFCTSLSVGSPEVRQNKREALALDGFIDLTEQFGRPVFGNRTIAWRFLVTEEDWQERCEEVRELIAKLHGRKVGILVDDYEGWRFEGRLSLERVTHQLDGTYIDITADCDPFRKDMSTYQLDASAQTFTRGPARVIVPDSDLTQYLRAKDSYSLTMSSSAAGTGYVYISGWGSRPNVLGGYDSSPQLAVDCKLTASGTSSVTYGPCFVPSDRAVWLSVIRSGATYIDSFSYVKVSVDGGTPVEVSLDPSTHTEIGTIPAGRTDPIMFTFTFSGTRPSSGTPRVLFYLEASFVDDGTGKHYPTSFMAPQVLYMGNVGTTPTAVEPAVQYTDSYNPGLIFAAGWDGRSLTTTGAGGIEVDAKFPVSGTSVQDLSNLGHRFYRLTGDIPPTAGLSDTEYIDIDGRKYYADDSAYTIKVNASDESTVTVHGSGPVLQAEGMEI